jgi:hypothetical protein
MAVASLNRWIGERMGADQLARCAANRLCAAGRDGTGLIRMARGRNHLDPRCDQPEPMRVAARLPRWEPVVFRLIVLHPSRRARPQTGPLRQPARQRQFLIDRTVSQKHTKGD